MQIFCIYSWQIETIGYKWALVRYSRHIWFNGWWWLSLGLYSRHETPMSSSTCIEILWVVKDLELRNLCWTWTSGCWFTSGYLIGDLHELYSCQIADLVVQTTTSMNHQAHRYPRRPERSPCSPPAPSPGETKRERDLNTANALTWCWICAENSLIVKVACWGLWVQPGIWPRWSPNW